MPDLPLSYDKTPSGQNRATFRDSNGAVCVVQEGSQSGLWVGPNGGRMLLTRDMVAELLPLLSRFVEIGSIVWPDPNAMIRSEYEAATRLDHWGATSREHRYKGGPPPLRTKRMQLAHEGRARRAGIPWDMVDLRDVYQHYEGRCGICGEPVSLDEFQIDHIKPLSKGGWHVFGNMQPAHGSCNSAKGDRLDYPCVWRPAAITAPTGR